MNLNFWDKYSQENVNWGFRKPELKIWGFIKDIQRHKFEIHHSWGSVCRYYLHLKDPVCESSAGKCCSSSSCCAGRRSCHPSEAEAWPTGGESRCQWHIWNSHWGFAKKEMKRKKKSQQCNFLQWMGTFIYVIQKHSDSTVSKPFGFCKSSFA